MKLALAAGAIVGIWLWDARADRFTVDDAFADAFGLDPALGRDGISLEKIVATVHPDEARGPRPDLKALFTTGYTRNAVVHNGVLDPGVHLIGKPFTIDELASAVRLVIEEKVGLGSSSASGR